MNPTTIILLLGSNLGDRLANLRQAIGLIENQLGVVLVKSKIYETRAWGKKDQPDFLNQAIQLRLLTTANELLLKIQSIETRMGRTRSQPWEARTMDIDIIYFGNEIINTPNLIVPHARMAERKFVLAPLAEISPGFIHPQLLKSNAVLLEECKDNLEVKLFTG